MEIWIILGVIALIVIWLISIFNRIVSMRQRRNNAFSDIDVQLKLRHDLIPNLINTVKAYAKHEDKLLSNITEARSQAMKSNSVKDKSEAESVLGAAMMNLMAVAENYPDLKADANFRQLQTELSDIENKIAAARRFFNNATSEFNTIIQQFPGVIVARMFNYTEEDFFELSEAEATQVKEPPKVSFDD